MNQSNAHSKITRRPRGGRRIREARERAAASRANEIKPVTTLFDNGFVKILSDRIMRQPEQDLVESEYTEYYDYFAAAGPTGTMFPSSYDATRVKYPREKECWVSGCFPEVPALTQATLSRQYVPEFFAELQMLHLDKNYLHIDGIFSELPLRCECPGPHGACCQHLRDFVDDARVSISCQLPSQVEYQKFMHPHEANELPSRDGMWSRIHQQCDQLFPHPCLGQIWCEPCSLRGNNYTWGMPIDRYNYDISCVCPFTAVERSRFEHEAMRIDHWRSFVHSRLGYVDLEGTNLDTYYKFSGIFRDVCDMVVQSFESPVATMKRDWKYLSTFEDKIVNACGGILATMKETYNNVVDANSIVAAIREAINSFQISVRDFGDWIKPALPALLQLLVFVVCTCLCFMFDSKTGMIFFGLMSILMGTIIGVQLSVNNDVQKELEAALRLWHYTGPAPNYDAAGFNNTAENVPDWANGNLQPGLIFDRFMNKEEPLNPSQSAYWVDGVKVNQRPKVGRHLAFTTQGPNLSPMAFNVGTQPPVGERAYVTDPPVEWTEDPNRHLMREGTSYAHQHFNEYVQRNPDHLASAFFAQATGPDDYLGSRLGSAIASAFGFGSTGRFVSDCHQRYMLVKDVGQVIQFIASLIPYTIQEMIFEKCPSIVPAFLYQNSGWVQYVERIERFKKTFDVRNDIFVKQGADLIAEGETIIRLSSGRPWYTAAKSTLDAFKLWHEEACTRHNLAWKGRQSFMFQISGPPRTGKTRAVRRICDLLASDNIGTGEFFADKVYEVPNGQYMENTGGNKVFMFNDFMGVHGEQNTIHASWFMSLADGNFKKTAASIAEKDRPCDVYAVGAASNYPYPAPADFQNVEALWARRNVHFYCDIDRTHDVFRRNVPHGEDPAHWATNLTIPEAMSHFEYNATALEKGSFAHQAIYCIPSSIPYRMMGELIANHGQGARNYNDLLPSSVKRYFREHPLPDGTIPTSRTKLTFTYVSEMIMELARTRNAHTEELTKNETAFCELLLKARRVSRPQAQPAHPPPAYEREERDLNEEEKKWWKYATIAAGAAIFASISTLAYLIYQRYKSVKAEAMYTDQRARDMLTSSKRAAKFRVMNVSAAGPIEDFEDNVDRNNALIVFPSEHTLNCTFVAPDVFATVSHSFLNADGTWKENMEFELRFADGQLFRERFNAANLVQLGSQSSDIMLYRISRSAPVNGRMWRQLTLREDRLRLGGVPLTRSTQGSSYTGEVASHHGRVKYNNLSAALNAKLEAINCYSFAGRCTVGDCGSPVYGVINGNPRLLGIINGAAANVSLVAVLDKDLVREALEVLQPQRLEALSARQTVAVGAMADVFDFDVDHDQIRTPDGEFFPVAKCSKSAAYNMKTELKKTVFHSAIEEYPVRVAPTKKDVDMIYEQEHKHGITRHPIEQELVEFGKNVVADHYPVPRRTFCKLSLDVAVNTIPPDASVGFGHSKKRKDLLPLGQDGLRHACQDIQNRIARIEALVSAGFIPACVVIPCLKDECRPLKKVQTRQTRTFEISPLEWLLIGRMYFGDLLDFLHENPVDWPNTVGLAATTRDWHVVMSKLHAMNPDRLIGIDYKAMEATVHWQQFKVFHWFCTRYYRDEGSFAESMRYAYLYAICHCLYLIQDNLLGTNHGNKSGMTGTVDLNTCVALFYPAVAFKSIFPDSVPSDFRKVVATILCGDDTGMAVHPSIEDRYNYISISAVLGSYGIVLTPANKDAEPTPFISYDEFTFCKKFVHWSTELAAFVPFVEFHTIMDQLAYARDVTRAGHVQIANSALEWVFFRGQGVENGSIPGSEPTFDTVREFILSRLPGCEDKIVSYETLLARYYTPRLGRTYVPPSSESVFGNSLFQTPMSDTTNKMAMDTPVQTAIFRAMGFFGDLVNDITSPITGLLDDVTDLHGPTNEDAPVGETHDTSSFENEGVETDTVPFICDLVASAMGHVTPSVAIVRGHMLDPNLDGTTNTVVLHEKRGRRRAARAHHFLNSENQMSFGFLKTLMTYIGAYSIPYDASNESLVGTIPLSPFQSGDRPGNAPTVGTVCDMGPLEFISWMHAMWHGDLRFQFLLAAPREVSLRLLIAFEYGVIGGPIPSYASALQMPCMYVTFDSSKREMIFEAPDINPVRWKRRPDFFENADYPNSYSNGRIHIYNATTPTSAPQPMTLAPQLYIFMSGASNFTWAELAPCPNLFFPDVDDDRFAAMGPADDGEAGSEQLVIPPSEEAAAGDPSENHASATVVEKQQVDAVPTTINRTATPPKPFNQTAPPVHIESLANKFLEFAKITIPATGPREIQRWNIPFDILKGQALLQTKNGRYWSGDARIRAQFTTSAWTGGLLALAYVPGIPSASPFPGDASLQRLLSLTHKKLDVATNTPQEFVVPFEYPLDYFDSSAPSELKNQGQVILFRFGDLQNPTTNVKPTTLTLQVKWDNFKTFIPTPIPSCVTVEAMGPTPKAPSMGGSLKRKPPAKPAPKPVSSTTPNVTNMVAATSTTTHKQQIMRKATTPLPAKKIAHSDASFSDYLSRPTPIFSQVVALASGATIQFPLPVFPRIPAKPIPKVKGLYNSSLAAVLGNMYRAFIGDTAYDIVLSELEIAPQESSGHTSGKLIATVAAVPSIDSDNILDGRLDCQLPGPIVDLATSLVPSRTGTADLAGLDYTVGSYLPFIQLQPDGKTRVVIPYESQTRYLQLDSPHPLLSAISTGVLTFFNSGESEIFFSFDVYQSLVKGAMFSQFQGVPPVQFDTLWESGTHANTKNYAGTYFIPETLEEEDDEESVVLLPSPAPSTTSAPTARRVKGRS